jgi:hypothetical protein
MSVMLLTTPESHHHRALAVHNVMADRGGFHGYAMILSTHSNGLITRLAPVGTVLRHVGYNTLTHKPPAASVRDGGGGFEMAPSAGCNETVPPAK